MDAAVKEAVSELPEELSKRAAKKYPILFRCAKRSILPNKAETWSQNLHRSFLRPAKAGKSSPKFLWSKFHSTKSQNRIFFSGSFLAFFEQSEKRF